MPRKVNAAIPSDHSFVPNEGFLISNEGKDVLDDMIKKMEEVDPNDFQYNDWYCSAITDIVDRFMSTLHTKVTKHAYEDAYPVLEGLTLFLVNNDDWHEHDDGERVVATDKAFGALAIALFKGLEKEGKLDTSHFPGLEGLMKAIAQWNDTMGDTFDLEYGLFIKFIGEKLFTDKTPEEIAVEKARQQEWIKTLPKKSQREMRSELRDAAEQRPWWEGGKDNHRDYAQTRAWKEYKQFASNVNAWSWVPKSD